MTMMLTQQQRRLTLTTTAVLLLSLSSQSLAFAPYVKPNAIVATRTRNYAGGSHKDRIRFPPVGQNKSNQQSAAATGLFRTTLPSVTKSSSLYMGVSYESLVEQLPSPAVLQAVEANSGNTVVASDVAVMAGVSLRQARRELTTLASLAQGDIAVSSDGDLLYTFPNNLSATLASKSAKFKAMQALRKAWPAIFFGIRVSFGLVLVASLLAIFSTIFFISQGSSNDDDRRRGDRGGGGMSLGGSMWGPSPLDFFYYRPYYGYYATAPGERPRDPEDMGFLESVFSYIFGDGNPNQALEEKRLQLASNYIRTKNGAVTAEELAPFCDDAPTPDFDATTTNTAYVNEAFVLPIVTALAGEPRVTDEGDIVYVFPELQLSASSRPVQRLDQSAIVLKKVGLEPDASARDIKNLLERSGISTRGALEKKDFLTILRNAIPPITDKDEELFGDEDPSMLLEQEYKFSLASDGNKVLAGGLGVVNLAGALYLGQMFQSYALYGVTLPSFFGIVQAGFPLLLSYAVLFNVIPLVRSLWIKTENAKIQQRNQKRRMWRTVLASGVSNITRKLNAASRLGTKMKQLKSSDAIFDTSIPLTENERKKQEAMLDEFDRMLDN